MFVFPGVFFDVKIRQVLRVETRVSVHVRVRGPSRQGILLAPHVKVSIRTMV